VHPQPSTWLALPFRCGKTVGPILPNFLLYNYFFPFLRTRLLKFFTAADAAPPNVIFWSPPLPPRFGLHLMKPEGRRCESVPLLLFPCTHQPRHQHPPPNKQVKSCPSAYFSRFQVRNSLTHGRILSSFHARPPGFRETQRFPKTPVRGCWRDRPPSYRDSRFAPPFSLFFSRLPETPPTIMPFDRRTLFLPHVALSLFSATDCAWSLAWLFSGPLPYFASFFRARMRPQKREQTFASLLFPHEQIAQVPRLSPPVKLACR